MVDKNEKRRNPIQGLVYIYKEEDASVLLAQTKPCEKSLVKRGRELHPELASMERGGEDDTGSGCKSMMSTGGSDATMGGGTAVKLQALRLAEDLSLPSVQVVVMSANMGCSHCRQRVTKVVTKMNGLLDYMVDFGKKEVTVRGTVLHTKKKRKKKHKISGLGSSWEKMPPASSSPNISARTLSWFLGCYRS